MRPLRLVRLASLAALLVVAAAPSAASAAAPAMDWQTGIRAIGNGATVEPAVNLTDGSQTFLITPNNAPFYEGGVTPGPIPPSLANVSAPLYLVTYPLDSTADTSAPFNCYTSGYFDHGASAYNCDHAQIPGIKGHDHLVGVPGSAKAGGDYNVQWHVWVTFFTQKGHDDGAMNTRILTWTQLQDAQAAGDVSPFIDTHIYFYCAAVSGAVYKGGTSLSFPPLP